MSGPVRRADGLTKPRGAKRTPVSPVSAAAQAHLRNPVVRSAAERTGLLRKAFQSCTPVNIPLSNAGTQSFAEYLSAQPVGGFGVCTAVRGGVPLVLGELAAPPVNSSPSVFSFVPCPARFLFGKSKRKCGGHSDGQSPSWACPPGAEKAAAVSGKEISCCGSGRSGIKLRKTPKGGPCP